MCLQRRRLTRSRWCNAAARDSSPAATGKTMTSLAFIAIKIMLLNQVLNSE